MFNIQDNNFNNTILSIKSNFLKSSLNVFKVPSSNTSATASTKFKLLFNVFMKKCHNSRFVNFIQEKIMF